MVRRASAVARRFDYRLVAGHRGDSGFANVADDRRRNFLTARSDWQLGAGDSLLLQAGGTNGTNDVSFGGANDPQRSVNLKTAYAQAKWEHSFDADEGMYVQVYYYHFRLTDVFCPISCCPERRRRCRSTRRAVPHRPELQQNQRRCEPTLGVGRQRA